MNRKKNREIVGDVDIQWFAENDDTVLADPPGTETNPDLSKRPVTSGFSSLSPIENIDILDEGLEEFEEIENFYMPLLPNERPVAEGKGS